MIEKVDELPMAELEPLIEESEHEGFRFLRRLADDWLSGKNRFDGRHEGLYVLRDGAVLVGIGGINIDPFSTACRRARLRRFYIRKSARRRGFGRSLVSHILNEAAPNYHSMVLRTDNADAGEFYEALGFVRVDGYEGHTHVLDLRHRAPGVSADRHNE